jgi:hypothetical protein
MTAAFELYKELAIVNLPNKLLSQKNGFIVTRITLAKTHICLKKPQM